MVPCVPCVPVDEPQVGKPEQTPDNKVWETEKHREKQSENAKRKERWRNRAWHGSEDLLFSRTARCLKVSVRFLLIVYKEAGLPFDGVIGMFVGRAGQPRNSCVKRPN